MPKRSSRSKKLAKSKERNTSKSSKQNSKPTLHSTIDSQKEAFPYVTSSRTIDDNSRQNSLHNGLPPKKKMTKKGKNKAQLEKLEAMNEIPSKRYSDVVFKDNVFDSKDDSTSGINELNLLQELTNFTNMKMVKDKRVRQKQHCIHFDRVIKN